MKGAGRSFRLLWSLIVFGLVMSLGFVSVPDALAAGSVKVSPTKGITGERVKFTIKTKVCSGSTCDVSGHG